MHRPHPHPASDAPASRRPFAVTVAVAAVAVAAAALTADAASTSRAQEPGPRFEGITLLADGHHAFARLAGLPEGAPPRWVEAAILPPIGACAPPACDPDAPRAVAHAQTVPDGGLELTFVTAGPFQRRPVRLRPGDRLRLRALDAGTPVRSDAPSEAIATVAPLVVALVDAAADRLSGTGPAGARLSITANRPDGAFTFAQATVGADGGWAADLAGTLDLIPGAFGAVSMTVDGVTTQASWSVPRAFVRLGDPVIDVYARSGASALATQDCGWGVSEITHAGRAIAWRGAGDAAPLVLRNVTGGSLGGPSDLMCGLLTVDIEGMRRPVDVSLPKDIDIDVAADDIHSAGPWPAGRYRVAAGGIARTVDVSPATSYWSVPLAGLVDLTSTLPVDVATADDTATVAWSMRAYPLSVTDVDPTIVRVRGRGVAGRYVSLTLGDDESFVGYAMIGPDGTFDVTSFDETGGPIPLAAGTIVRVSDVIELRTMPGDGAPGPPVDGVAFVAAPLRARALANRDLVEGTARPGARVHVVAGAGQEARAAEAVAAADGAWAVDFTDIVDLVPGTPIAVEAGAADGYRSALAFPVFRAAAQVGGDRVVVEGHPGLSAEVEVAWAGALIGRAACRIPDDAAACTARVKDDAGAPVRMRGGDEVVVLPDAGGSASLQLVNLTAHIDATARSVVGACPPGAEMRVAFHAPADLIAPFDASTTADGNGVCDYELSRGEWDLLAPGVSADLIQALPGGHRIFATGAYEQAHLYPNDHVAGLAEPFAPVTLTLRSAAGVDRRLFTVVADGEGRWTTDAPAADRTVHTPGPGETLLVDDGRRRHALPYTPLTAWWDGPLGAVVAVTNPDQPVRIVHTFDARPCSPWSSGRPAYAALADTADTLGTFALTEPPVDACAVGRAEVAAALASGDDVRFVMPTRVAAGGRVYLPVGVR